MNTSPEGLVTVFLCGDIMTGRGIDQILPHPSDPRIYEPVVTDARTYVPRRGSKRSDPGAGRAVVHLGRCSG
jgi:poly-gamma-glutamate capsule biosynthesis protein CapA/YwtB (metallophosphatase superfamily)